ncbi:MAG: cohesin domain-containing protein [Phycisphaerae bacterium]|nr:cohesin domain-containing protein [Phycisphaerae bacterium]
MRAKVRFPTPLNVFNSNGDGTYTFKKGWGGVGDPLNPFWHFEWSVNTNWNGSSPYLLDDLTYEIGMDFDPGPGTDHLTFDQITPAQPAFFWDHSIGTNATGNGAGVEAATAPAYAALLAANNVAQNSWRPTFFDNYWFSFDPTVVGRYEYYVSAFSGAGRVARTAITIFALDKVSLTIDGDGCQNTDQDPITPGTQIKVTLNVRNPDSVPVTGYQAFLDFNPATMTYVGATSSYSAMPFVAHVQNIATANVSAGKLRLDGSVLFGGSGILDDALAATLFFTVTPSTGCDSYSVSFDLGQPFPSETSDAGLPYATDLLNSPAIVRDTVAPTISAQPTLIVNAEPGVCTADIFPQVFPFNADPALSPTAAPGVFYTDRYAPFLFESAFFDGDFRLLHQVNSADSAANRPPAFMSAFYNTQGRKLDINSATGTSVSMDLYIGSDWGGPDNRRADLWLTTFDSLNDISGFPILGFAQIMGDPLATGNFRVFTQDIDNNPSNGYTPGWVSLGLYMEDSATASGTRYELHSISRAISSKSSTAARQCSATPTR